MGERRAGECSVHGSGSEGEEDEGPGEEVDWL